MRDTLVGLLNRAILICAVLVVGPGTALYADSTDFELAQPTPAGEGGILVRGARVPNGTWTVGGILQAESLPVSGSLGQTSRLEPPEVGLRTQGRLLVGRSVVERAYLYLDAPVVLYEDQNLFAGQTAGFNDLSVGVRTTLFDSEVFALAVDLVGTFPTGRSDVLGGTDLRAVQSTSLLLLETNVAGFYGRLNGGYQERQRTRIDRLNVVVDDRIVGRAAAGWSFSEQRLDVFGEFSAAYQVDVLPSQDVLMADAGVGLQHEIAGYRLTAGFTIGVGDGYGVPTYRMIAGVYHELRQRAENQVIEAPPETGELTIRFVDQDGKSVSGVRVDVLRDSLIIESDSTGRGGDVEFEFTSGTILIQASHHDFEPAMQEYVIVPGTDTETSLSLTRKPPPDPGEPTIEEQCGDDANCKLRLWKEKVEAQN